MAGTLIRRFPYYLVINYFTKHKFDLIFIFTGSLFNNLSLYGTNSTNLVSITIFY